MDSKNWINAFKFASEGRKKSLKVTKKGIKAFTFKKRFQVKKTSPEEIEQYIRNNGIKSRKELRERIKQGDMDAPTDHAIRCCFGNWTNLYTKIYGVRQGYVQYTPEEIITLFVHLNVTDTIQYWRVKQKDKYLIPSYKQLVKHFGKVGLLWRIVKAQSKKNIFERFVKFCEGRRKLPTNTECRKNGIEIDELLKIMNRDDLSVFVKYFSRRNQDEE